MRFYESEGDKMHAAQNRRDADERNQMKHDIFDFMESNLGKSASIDDLYNFVSNKDLMHKLYDIAGDEYNRRLYAAPYINDLETINMPKNFNVFWSGWRDPSNKYKFYEKFELKKGEKLA